MTYPIRKEGTLRSAVGYSDMNYDSGPSITDWVPADPGAHSNGTKNTTKVRDWPRNSASHHNDQCGQPAHKTCIRNSSTLAVRVSLTWSPNKGWSASTTREANPFWTPDGLQASRPDHHSARLLPEKATSGKGTERPWGWL